MTELDRRTLEELRKLAPHRPFRRTTRIVAKVEEKLSPGPLGNLIGRYRATRWCVYCGRGAKMRSLVVSPITLRRTFVDLCGRASCDKRLREWEGASSSRLRRAQYDWERQHPEAAALSLIGHIPPQYPSVSRATLRAFLDSGEDVATVQGCTDATALNGSIKSLGFSDRVFAEIRSGQVVLRRSPEGTRA